MKWNCIALLCVILRPAAGSIRGKLYPFSNLHFAYKENLHTDGNQIFHVMLRVYDGERS